MKRQLLAALILLVLDGVWIWSYMGPRYRAMVPQIQGGRPMAIRTQFAAVAYILMILGMNNFVLPRVRKETALVDSLRWGFTFGVILYGVYDATAAAVLKDWDLKLALIDVIWGGFVYAISAYLATVFV